MPRSHDLLILSLIFTALLNMVSPSRPPTPEYLAENTSHMLVTVSIAFIVIDTFFVGLRFVSRRYEPAKVGANDVFLVIGWLNCLAQCADGIGMWYITTRRGSTGIQCFTDRICSKELATCDTYFGVPPRTYIVY